MLRVFKQGTRSFQNKEFLLKDTVNAKNLYGETTQIHSGGIHQRLNDYI